MQIFKQNYLILLEYLIEFSNEFFFEIKNFLSETENKSIKNY